LAKFKKNHGKSSRANSFLGRAVWTTLLLVGGILYLFVTNYSSLADIDTDSNGESDYGQPSAPVVDTEFDRSAEDVNFYPKGADGQLVEHRYYSLMYNEDMEQADWVAYKLSRNSLAMPNVDRQRRFNVDPKVKTRSAKHSDYSHSGYTRGHMAPAGDMAFNKEAMKQSFFMSNMSPQTKELNAGIWNNLEQNVRDWAFANREIYVVTGPVFYDNKPQRIGKNQVAVPDAFYKAILDYDGTEKKAVGFLIPHEDSDDHLHKFAVSIEELEEQVGLDFFSDVYSDVSEEEEIESQFSKRKWKVKMRNY